MALHGTVWAPIGPSPMSEGGGQDNGLVTALAVHPSNPSVLYLGTAQGGVWRSGDGGKTWTPLFDRQLSLGIGEPGGIAIDPGNTSTIYVGTSGRVGSAEPDTVRQPTAGLFKSTDGGASWIALGSGFPAGNTGNAGIFVNQNINVILVDPASGVLYLASARGVFTSSDGGQNWTAAAGISTDTRSLALDLSSPPGARILHAGVSGRGVFRSTDGGRTFSQTLSATTPAVAAALGSSSFTRVVVALAPPTSPPNANGVQVLYVTMAGPYNGTPDPVGVFLSKDQGATWTQQAATGMSGTTYGGYALDMIVDPASPGDGSHDVLYLGCLSQFKSTDSGASFTAHSVGHADTHVWTCVRPTGGGSTTVYCGCDGGLYVSPNAGLTWNPLNSGGLQTGLFYNIAIKPDATASVTVGALQDNRLQTTAGVTSPAWNATQGGDGWDIAYDGSVPPVLYGSSGGPASSIDASTDDGLTFPTSDTPPWTSADTGGFLLTPIAADPSASGILYASGLQNLWQRLGGTWRIIAAPGTSGNVDVAPASGNNVVIAAGSQVFVSTNALAATVGPPAGVTFTNITRNLPGRNVARAVFDPVDPTVIYAVLTGFDGGTGQNVFRTTVGATAWTNISPALDLPCGAIAVDGTTTPTTLYVGTDLGVIRSVDGGASWSVLDDLRFPRAPVFDLAFNAQAGVLRAATYGRGVFEFTLPVGPAIAVSLQDQLAFGVVCGGPRYLTLDVYNVGAADLVITSVQRLVGSAAFVVLPTPSVPLVIHPGAEVTFTVAYTPTGPGVADVAVIRIISNDPTAPFVDVTATGTRGAGKLATAIPDHGDFGDVCPGRHADALLTINNPGVCPLTISNMTSSSADFQVPGVASYPLKVEAQGSIDVAIRFRPVSPGAKSATIQIVSDDPAGPHALTVTGTAPAPRLTLVLADTGYFGKVCVGRFLDQPLILNNSGKCTLTVTGMTSSSPEFLMPQVLSYPIMIGPGESLPVPIRFAPTSFGAKSAALTVYSDDPAGPHIYAVSGLAPSGKLAVTGTTHFGGVTAGCCADRTISICNVGECDLRVTSVQFRRASRYWKLLHNPFPATLHAGSCLDAVIQYRATEKCPRSCELVIASDDPSAPVTLVEVLAYTICDPCPCKACCDDCRKGCCDRRHQEACCRQGYPCCCDDEVGDDRRDSIP